MRLPSLNNMMSHAMLTVRRFPMEILVALIGTISVMTYFYLDHRYAMSLSQEEDYMHVGLSCILLLNVALWMTIAYEARRITAMMRWVLFACVGGLLTWFVFSLSTAEWDIQRYVAAALMVHAGVALSGAWNRSRRGFWEFNKTLFLRTLTGALFTGVLVGGVNLALLSLSVLFDVDIDGWMNIWVTMILVGLFNTLFVLGGIPPTPARQSDDDSVRVAGFVDNEAVRAAMFTSEADLAFPRGLRIFTQFVLLPLVVMFMCILYAYGVKVLFFASLEGSVSGFILALAIVGVLAYLLVYPLRNESEHAWISWYARWFGRLMVPLSVMLWVAIAVRVDAYGITEERYVIISLGACLSLISVYLAVWRDPDLRFIPAVLCTASLLAFVGPFSMTSVSYNSQTDRANSVLRAYKVIAAPGQSPASFNSGVSYDTTAAARMPWKDADVVKSVVRYLDDYGHHDRVSTWLSSIGAPTPATYHTSSVELALNIDHNVDYSRRSLVSLTLKVNHLVPAVSNIVHDGTVQPFTIRYYYSSSMREDYTFTDDGTWTVQMPRDGSLRWVVLDPDGNTDTLHFRNDLHNVEDTEAADVAPSSYVQTADFPTRRVRFVFSNMNARLANNAWESVEAEGIIIVEKK